MSQNAEGAGSPASICLTPSCVLAASHIIDNLSPTYAEVDPCTDFNKYVCEGFTLKHELRADQGALFTATLMSENGQQILRQVLETPLEAYSEEFETLSSSKRRIFAKLKDFYDSCMDEAQIKSAGSAPLISVLKDLEGHFPARRPSSQSNALDQVAGQIRLHSSISTNDKLTQTVAYLQSIGVTAILSFSVGVGFENTVFVLWMLTVQG